MAPRTTDNIGPITPRTMAESAPPPATRPPFLSRQRLPSVQSRLARPALYVAASAVVVAVVIVGASAAFGVFSSGASSPVSITYVTLNPLSERATCWTATTGPGGPAASESNFTTTWTLSYLGGNSEPASCTAESVSVTTEGFSIVSANTPLVVSAGESRTLTVVLRTPAAPFTGTVTIDLAVHTESTAIGSAFAVGDPIFSTCASGDTVPVRGCTAGDYTYTLIIESSSVTFGSVLFEVKTAGGAIYSASSATDFAIVTVSGTAVAYSTFPGGVALAMVATFAEYTGTTTVATALTTLYTIVIDVGQTSTVGQGLTFDVTGTGGYTGSVSPVTLP